MRVCERERRGQGRKRGLDCWWWWCHNSPPPPHTPTPTIPPTPAPHHTYIQNLYASIEIREPHIHGPIKPPRPDESRVQNVPPIGCSHDNDTAAFIKAIHFTEHHVEGVVTLIVALEGGEGEGGEGECGKGSTRNVCDCRHYVHTAYLSTMLSTKNQNHPLASQTPYTTHTSPIHTTPSAPSPT